jgi:hypothetical protein
MAHPEPEGGTLPLYVIDPDLEPEAPSPPAAESPRHQHLADAVHDSWAALGRAAQQLSDRLAAPSAAIGGTGYETAHGLVIAIARHLVMAPGDAVRAFDALLPRLAEPIVTRRGTLTLSVDSVGRGRPDRSQLRAIGGRLHLWLSPVPLPVEMDLVPWGRWRTMITLHPDRRFAWSVGPHRRSRYFAAGHAAMDAVIEELRSLSGASARPPYDAARCGRSWSMPTPAPTA